MKDLGCSSSRYTESPFLYVLKHNLLSFFSIWLFFHEYSRFTKQQVKGEAISLYLLFANSTRFTDTQTLAGLLLQRAHLCIKLAVGIEHETFGTRSLEFTFSTLAVVVNRVIWCTFWKFFVCILLDFKKHTRKTHPSLHVPQTYAQPLFILKIILTRSSGGGAG